MSKNWAICVGINGYYNLKPLKYAQRDAEAMRGFCQDARFETVYFFGEGAAPIQQDYGPPLRAEPTFGNLDRFLDVRFREPFLEAGDNLWFFFAGHGRRYANRDYLMPIDGNPGKVERTGLAIADIADRLRDCGADNIILMLDACRGDDDRDGGEGIGVEQQQGVITLFSCSPSEMSYEIDELQQGAFTHALLQGLRLQGEGNCATVERLYQHLRYQVPALNQRYKKQRQTPYAIAEPATKLHLILLPDRATLQDVQALKVDAFEAEAETDWELAEQLWIRVLVASPGDRQAVKALKRIGRLSVQSAPTAPATQSAKPASSQAGSRAAANRPMLSFETVKVDAQGRMSQPEQRRTEYRRETLSQGVSLDLVAVPGGEFVMGSPSAETGRDWYGRWNDSFKGVNVESQHKVKVPAFLMGKYPVTQAQWRAVCALPKVSQDLEADPSNFKGDQRPVEQVSWDAAVEFCQRLSRHSGREYRLPSEAEWEYACRAGTSTPFYFGETITTDLANYSGVDFTYEDKTYPGNYGAGPKGEYREQTTDVGSFPANSFGLYDMHGNVLEWCLDYWHKNYEGAPADGSAWTEGGEASLRVLRGGSWGSNPDDCRSANRLRSARDLRGSIVGFRVVCAASWTLE
ncbi:SUMF1/EgtB/PvdO family nonheme iron enzyme [Congregibacter sp.]|uniref:SUMF1/EgtB/PvdO family nonheme iron enzyme n=1 Tax=Congregibacter sp. TaxID=2744308 RepID=UPI003859C230